MIAIICAMDKELKYYVDSLQDKKIRNILNYCFIEGFINNSQVVIVKSGIGKMASGIVTTLLIEHFKPNLIINSGIAGGFDKSLSPLDVLVVNKVGCYDIDMRLDGLEFGTFEAQNRFFKNDLRINPIEDINVQYGLIMSSDTFAGDRRQLETIFNEHFKDELILAVDMESYAIAKIASEYNIEWCIIRAISDIVGMDSQIDSYQEFAETAAKQAFVIIEKNFFKSI